MADKARLYEIADIDEFVSALGAAIKPRLDADEALWAEHGEAAVAAFDATGAVMKNIGGNCPVQAEGTVEGCAFYFRARGDEWQFHVAPTDADIFSERELFYIERAYGAGPFDAGWMPLHEAYGFITDAIGEFRAARKDHPHA
ncbi:MAG: hypothetical protein ACRCYS_11210 [Beijerinckiaceae bacterium]